MLSPAFVVFSFISLCGTVLAVLSGGLLGVWLSLELSFFGFIPILNGKGVCENESAVKYFIVQSIGSGFLLMSFILISSYIPFCSLMIFSNELVNMLMLFGFLIKLGVFPMHFWFPSVMGSASWFSCFWLGVVQKVGPFWGISGVGLSKLGMNLFILLSVITSVVGSFGGLAQTHIRPLLAYSSLGQVGWMSLVLMNNLGAFIWYYLLYSLILSGLLIGLSLVNYYNSFGGVNWSESGGLMFWIFSGSYFLSLAGMPPFSGFFLKLVGVVVVVSSSPFFMGVLIFSAMVSLYFYLSMFLSSVFCVSSVDYMVLSSHLSKSSIPLMIFILGLLNWLGGIPLLLFFCFFIF